MASDEILWRTDAKEFAATYGLSKEDVERIVRARINPQIDPRSHEVGHLIIRYRAGDVVVVVGYREVDAPMVMSVWVDHHHESKAKQGSRTPAGSGKSAPTTVKELTKRVLASGYKVEMGGSHYRVVDKETGDFLMSLPLTPSDHRTVPNVWATFLRKHAQAQREKGSET